MVNKIFKCQVCKIYTLKQQCPNCNKNTLTARPPKYSLLDKYGEYRRKYNEMVHEADQ